VLGTPVVIPIGSIGSQGSPENCSDFIYGTEYLGNFEYGFENDCGNYGMYLDKIYNSEGYAVGLYNNYPNWYSSLNFFYYRKDHLGNNREVWCGNTNGTVQRTQYYPSGLPWAEGYNANPYNIQSRKYNGKEWIEAHGLDEYDSQARMYYPAIMRTTTLDPLAEKYYSISPYAWCGNNPVRNVDPDGRVLKYAPGYTQAFKQDVINTIRYMNTKGTSGNIKNIMSKKETVFIKETSGGSRFDANTNTLYWNPEMGIVTTNGIKLSPATALGHEADHAQQWLNKPEQYKQDIKKEVSSYDNKEDRRVILGSEQDTAKKHEEIQEGETTRYDHSAEKVIKTTSPTTTQIKQIVKEEDKK